MKWTKYDFKKWLTTDQDKIKTKKKIEIMCVDDKRNKVQ